jgi:ABC-type lipoprotein release transport system permease subunit
VYYTAQSHYSGDIVAVGYDSGSQQLYHLEQSEVSAIQQAAAGAGINAWRTVRRTSFGDKGVVFFNGAAVRLKYVLGVEWEGEKHLFDKMSFEGTPEIPAGDDGILISALVAAALGARQGDSVILETETKDGQKDTGIFIVRGIVRDASLFGYYKAYVSRQTLNRLLAYDAEDCSSIGYFLDDPDSADTERLRLQAALEGAIQMGPLVNNRNELFLESARPWKGVRVFLYTLPVYLSDISNLLDALNIITYFLYGMMLLIILVSAAVTYRLILQERTKELGIMRAIGFYGGDLRQVLWTEILALGLIALAGGFVFALILSWAVSFVSFSWFPSFEIFLKDGKLTPLYVRRTMIINIVSIFVLLFAAVWLPALRSSKKPLPELLSGGSR